MIFDSRFSILDFIRTRTAVPARLVFTLAIACAAAHAESPQSKIENRESKIVRPYLWKIEGKDPKPSWLFGTIHLQRPDVTGLPAVVKQAISHSDAVYTEIPSDLASMLSLMPKMMLPKGKSLKTMLGPALTNDLEKAFQSINPRLSAAPFLPLKPWVVAATLFELEDQMKYPTALALDTIIYQHAASAGKEVGGIETPDEQFAALDSFSDSEQVAMIKDSVRQLRDFRNNGRSLPDFLAGLYLAGDLDKLVIELNKLDTSGEDPELNEKFMDRLLYRRNAIMSGRIIQKIQAHPGVSYFFAVGAAHLQGDRGLIVSLEKAGFRLTRVQ